MDTDQRDRSVRVLLDDLVSDPHERAAHVITVEDDRNCLQRAPSWPHGTGLKGPTWSEYQWVRRSKAAAGAPTCPPAAASPARSPGGRARRRYSTCGSSTCTM